MGLQRVGHNWATFTSLHYPLALEAYLPPSRLTPAPEPSLAHQRAKSSTGTPWATQPVIPRHSPAHTSRPAPNKGTLDHAASHARTQSCPPLGWQPNVPAARPPTGYSNQPTTTIQWPHAAHTGDTPRAYSPVTREEFAAGPHRKSLYKVISPRSGNLNNLPNNRNKQRIRQNKKTEEYVLNKEQDKTSEKELNGAEINNTNTYKHVEAKQ